MSRKCPIRWREDLPFTPWEPEYISSSVFEVLLNE